LCFDRSAHVCVIGHAAATFWHGIVGATAGRSNAGNIDRMVQKDGCGSIEFEIFDLISRDGSNGSK